MTEFKHAEIIGPFTAPEYCYASVGGYKVPYIKLVKLTGEKDGKIEIHLDSNVWVVDDTEIDLILHMLATCMARAAGYTSHGENSEPFNPFKLKMIGL